MQFYPRTSDYEQLGTLAGDLAAIACRVKDSTAMSPVFMDRTKLRGVYADAKQAKVLSEAITKFMDTFKET